MDVREKNAATIYVVAKKGTTLKAAMAIAGYPPNELEQPALQQRIRRLAKRMKGNEEPNDTTHYPLPIFTINTTSFSTSSSVSSLESGGVQSIQRKRRANRPRKFEPSFADRPLLASPVLVSISPSALLPAGPEMDHFINKNHIRQQQIIHYQWPEIDQGITTNHQEEHVRYQQVSTIERHSAPRNESSLKDATLVSVDIPMLPRQVSTNRWVLTCSPTPFHSHGGI